MIKASRALSIIGAFISILVIISCILLIVQRFNENINKTFCLYLGIISFFNFISSIDVLKTTDPYHNKAMYIAYLILALLSLNIYSLIASILALVEIRKSKLVNNNENQENMINHNKKLFIISIILNIFYIAGITLSTFFIIIPWMRETASRAEMGAIILAPIYGFLLILIIIFVIALIINLILTIFALKTKTKEIFKMIYPLGIICLTIFNTIGAINNLNKAKSC